MKVCHLRVVNWETYQQYKDRAPHWIKLHNRFLEDPGIAALPDHAKGQLLGIWLLASRLDNKIPGDAEFIGKRINATVPVELSLMLRMGFVEWTCECSEHRTSPYRVSEVRTEPYTEEKRREKEEKRGEESREQSGADAPRAVFDHWREAMKHPEAKFTRKRLALVKARLSEGYTVDQLKAAIDGCRASPFHQGQNERATVYDDLELICRSGEKVEQFLQAGNPPTRAAPRSVKEQKGLDRLRALGGGRLPDADQRSGVGPGDERARPRLPGPGGIVGGNGHEGGSLPAGNSGVADGPPVAVRRE